MTGLLGCDPNGINAVPLDRVNRAVYTIGMRSAWFLYGLGFLILIGGTWLIVNQPFTPRVDTTRMQEATSSPQILTLTSPAFSEGNPIPSEYTCDADDIAPILHIKGAPEGTQSFALIMDDPDAPRPGGFLHWVLFNIPGDASQIGPTGSIGVNGQNGWGREGYGGPCPPSGEHRYYFRLYALDMMLGLSAGATKDEVEQAMQGHILGEAQLMGRYQRK
jgi:Raf kinase inhibitor-like YbhB/YbcL family protein